MIFQEVRMKTVFTAFALALALATPVRAADCPEDYSGFAIEFDIDGHHYNWQIGPGTPLPEGFSFNKLTLDLANRQAAETASNRRLLYNGLLGLRERGAITCAQMFAAMTISAEDGLQLDQEYRAQVRAAWTAYFRALNPRRVPTDIEFTLLQWTASGRWNWATIERMLGVLS